MIRAIVAAASIVASAAPAPAPAPEHARLSALAGTWDVEMTFWLQPGSPGLPTRGVSTIRPLFNGTFIEEKIEGTLNGAPFTTLSWTGFNTSSHKYEATRIASTNTIQIAESGAWDDAAKRFDLKGSYAMAGSTWTQRTVIEPTSPTTMVATSYLSFGNVPEWKAVEIRYTKHAGDDAQPSADPLVATWVVNVPKSTYDPGPPPKSLSIIVVPDPEGYKLTQDEVAADGKASHDVFIFKPDGKEYPVTSRAGATVALTRIDNRTYERVTRVNGKATMTSRTVVSPDGKTRTTTTTGTDSQGRAVHEVIIYDRK